jgi:hypothetical protein
MNKLVMTCIALIGLNTAMAADVKASKSLQLSLTPDIALQSKTERINGVALSIWGENSQYAFAFGFVNGSTGDSSGFSWSYILNYAEDYTGVQWGMANYNKGSFHGWQSGIVNYAGTLKGLQLGLVNYAEKGDSGVQVGLVNIIPENKWFSELPPKLAPGMIFVNWSF